MIAQEIAETFKTNTSGGAAIGPGYTYSGHPVGAAAAIACLKETQRPDVKTNAGLRGEHLLKVYGGLERNTILSARCAAVTD